MIVQASGATVSGRVIDGSGAGIRDVSLAVWSLSSGYGFWESAAATTTDPSGRYTLGPVETGEHALFVSAPGDRYADRTLVLPVEGSDSIRLGDIRLDPVGAGGTVSVRVRSITGEGLQSTVLLCPFLSATTWQRANSGTGEWCTAGPPFVLRGRTSASGDFDFGGLAAGRYRADTAGDFRFWGDAQEVTVEDGGHERVEFEVVPWDYRFEGAFLDDEGSVHEEAIDAVAGRGLLRGTGCGPGRICPSEGITRAVMAVWLGRALAGGEPQPIEGSRFADVDLGGRHAFEAAHIERFAELGVTAGCRTEPLRYCPDRVVTRAEMATFLLRALDLDIPEESAGFTDVDSGSVHAPAIDALRASGITLGCRAEPLQYCPDQPVKRAEMATFIHRSLALLDERAEEQAFQGAVVLEPGTRFGAELAPGQRAHFRFQASAGQDVVVETHGDLDLYAVLRRVLPDAPDEILAENDDGGDGVNSRIVLGTDLLDPEPGWYLIEVRGYRSSVAGPYEISLSSG